MGLPSGLSCCLHTLLVSEGKARRWVRNPTAPGWAGLTLVGLGNLEGLFLPRQILLRDLSPARGRPQQQHQRQTQACPQC